jgi:hypothetical protein
VKEEELKEKGKMEGRRQMNPLGILRGKCTKLSREGGRRNTWETMMAGNSDGMPLSLPSSS